MSDEKKPKGELTDEELGKASGGGDGSVFVYTPVATSITILENGVGGVKKGPTGPGPGGGS